MATNLKKNKNKLQTLLVLRIQQSALFKFFFAQLQVFLVFFTANLAKTKTICKCSIIEKRITTF